ncbi:DUF4199 domain-containing protein [Phaeodactylibacter xiamenensis]|jgi:hypothetical protein|uniref:DUF4199 domain-containing protein n=1 Tax=Phaeodactylibacter xiamenensis TaxID=1524460 RepID=UPI0024A8DF50|nr:DUF4199 domain-containing protein [Phaeodactylibacter xiamenensis]
MKKYATEIKWALIFCAAALVWMVFEKAMGWHGPKIEKHPYMTNIFGLVAIVIYVLALREKREKLGGQMTWKQGFMSGLIISIIVGLLSPVTQWITHALISPEYFSNAIAYSVEVGYHDSPEAAAEYFNLQSYMMQGGIGAIIMGVVTSAVVAIFLKRSPETA